VAYPVIIIDSGGGGGDLTASGAGPGDGTTAGTVLTGTAAATDGTGTVVILDGSPSLAGVLTDGSHAIFVNDTTSAARNFGAITAKDDVAKTVTVGAAFGLSLTGKVWAIGGKRVSFGGTASRKLVDNVSTGDALPGWTVRMKGGHAESYATAITFRRAGTAAGRITIEGEEGAATMPTLTATANVNHLTLASLAYLTVRHLRFRNTFAASKTGAVAINTPGAANRVRNCRADDPAAPVLTLVNATSTSAGLVLEDCLAASTTGTSLAFFGALVRNNYVKNSAGAGLVDGSTGRYKSQVTGNIVAGCATGLAMTGVTSASIEDFGLVANNTLHGNATGISVAATATFPATLFNLDISSNNITGNTVIGIAFAGAGVDDTLLAAAGTSIRSNNFGTGATANPVDITPACAGTPTDSLHVDPAYAATGSDDYAVGAALKAAGWPSYNVGRLTPGTRNYVDVGAAQRQESAAASTYLILQS